jgi:hypothetical protein
MPYHRTCSGPRGQAFAMLPCGHPDQIGDKLCGVCAKEKGVCRLCGEPLYVDASKIKKANNGN